MYFLLMLCAFTSDSSLVKMQFVDVKGNVVYFDSLLMVNEYTLIVNVYYKKSKDSKKVREFVEGSFEELLHNNTLGIFQLLDISEVKGNNLVKRIVISALKKKYSGKNMNKPVLLDFNGKFEEKYGINKEMINCYIFDNNGYLEDYAKFSDKFNVKEQDSLKSMILSKINAEDK